MSEARERILARLRANRPSADAPPPGYRKPLGWDRERRVAEFTARMRAVRGEVHRLPSGEWGRWLVTYLRDRGLSRALIGRGAVAVHFAAAVGAEAFDVSRYDRPVDQWKGELFNRIDFAVTGARAGLAESGSLVLWPDTDEPRLMSLVPPLHVAVLPTDHLYDNFAEMLTREDWTAGMPSNALLVSGPSKTADIEQTLAFGIHGPKQLITLLID